MAEITPLVSVKKPAVNTGRPMSKKTYILIFEWSQVETAKFGVFGFGAVITFKKGEKPLYVAAAPDSIVPTDKLVGEPGGTGYLHSLAFKFLGTSGEMIAFRELASNRELGAFVFSCRSINTIDKGQGMNVMVLGTPCSPLRLSKDEARDDKDSYGHDLEFTNTFPVGPIMLTDVQEVPKTGDAEVDALLGLTKDNSGSPEAASETGVGG